MTTPEKPNQPRPGDDLEGIVGYRRKTDGTVVPVVTSWVSAEDHLRKNKQEPIPPEDALYSLYCEFIKKQPPKDSSPTAP